MVSYDIGGIDTGDNTLYADVTGLSLTSTRIAIQSGYHYDPDRLPAGGHQVSIQVWRGHATKILMDSHWRETEDNPFTHTGIAPVLLLILATIAGWALTILITILHIKGFLTARKASAANDTASR
jgi:hypothetical protein